MRPEAEKELVACFLQEGYVRRNFEAAGECLCEDYWDHSPAGARNRREAVEILRAVSGVFGDVQIHMEHIFSEKDLVAVRVRYSMVHTGTWMGIAASGRRITFEALEHFRISQGRIAESWGYWPDGEIERLLR